MSAWIAILLALLLIYFTLHPSHEGYGWYLQLRRPRWFDFEQHIPFIWLGLYVFFFNSARLVLEPQWKWGYAASFLLLVAMAQGTSWLTCTSRSLKAGVVLGILAWLWNLGMVLSLLSVSTTAALLLVPYLIWGPIVIVGRHQMDALNANSRRKPGRRSLAEKT
jgi:tryptophan-rich sensory protein